VSVIEYLEPSKQLKLWKKLRTESVIPVVDTETYKRRAEILSALQQKIRRCDYHPQQVLGFLGLCKSSGATRFVPVFSVEDFSVYYACTSALQDTLCFDIEGVYGGWRMSANVDSNQEEDGVYGDLVCQPFSGQIFAYLFVYSSNSAGA
jgi:hypothetical protein